MPSPPRDPAAPDEAIELRSLADVQARPDGRIGATLVLSYPNLSERRSVLLLVLVRAEVHWLIDDIVGELGFSVP